MSRVKIQPVNKSTSESIVKYVKIEFSDKDNQTYKTIPALFPKESHRDDFVIFM